MPSKMEYEVTLKFMIIALKFAFFHVGASLAWCQIPSEVIVKMMFSAFLQNPRPSVKAMFIFRTIYTGIFSLLFHNNNYN